MTTPQRSPFKEDWDRYRFLTPGDPIHCPIPSMILAENLTFKQAAAIAQDIAQTFKASVRCEKLSVKTYEFWDDTDTYIVDSGWECIHDQDKRWAITIEHIDEDTRNAMHQWMPSEGYALDDGLPYDQLDEQNDSYQDTLEKDGQDLRKNIYGEEPENPFVYNENSDDEDLSDTLDQPYDL